MALAKSGLLTRAATYHQINNGSSQYLPEYGYTVVTNNSGHTLFIPTNSQSEWNAFVAHLPSGVTTAAPAITIGGTTYPYPTYTTIPKGSGNYSVTVNTTMNVVLYGSSSGGFGGTSGHETLGGSGGGGGVVNASGISYQLRSGITYTAHVSTHWDGTTNNQYTSFYDPNAGYVLNFTDGHDGSLAGTVGAGGTASTGSGISGGNGGAGGNACSGGPGNGNNNGGSGGGGGGGSVCAGLYGQAGGAGGDSGNGCGSGGSGGSPGNWGNSADGDGGRSGGSDDGTVTDGGGGGGAGGYVPGYGCSGGGGGGGGSNNYGGWPDNSGRIVFSISSVQ